MTNPEKLKAWLKDQGYMNRWLSKRLVCSVTTVSYYLMGRSSPSKARAEKIAELTQGAVPADQWGK